MTKAQQIRALYDGVRSTREIADKVGCLPSYVRVVARQRDPGGLSDIDRRYLARVREHGDGDKARAAFTATYRAARRQGKTWQEARALGTPAYWRTLRKTAALALKKRRPPRSGTGGGR